jgi:hypothetical protein
MIELIPTLVLLIAGVLLILFSRQLSNYSWNHSRLFHGGMFWRWFTTVMFIAAGSGWVFFALRGLLKGY